MKNKFVPFYKLRRWKYHWLVRYSYRRQILSVKDKLKVVLGAWDTAYDGWISTDYPFFDITQKRHWTFLFKHNRPDALLAEHVIEHLTDQQVKSTLENAYNFLNPNGSFRIAVPDRNHVNPDYIEYVRPGGSGPGCDDHKSFWNYQSLSALAKKAGFKCELQEYYDDNKKFVLNNYPLDRGFVTRSRLNSHFKDPIKEYSSLIVDCIKS